jgi:hypothetical protein
MTELGIGDERILDDIGDEVARQLEIWGVEFDIKNTPNDWVAYITRYVSDGAYDGISASYSLVKFRQALIKSAALCVSAVRMIDSGTMAKRHYDN